MEPKVQKHPHLFRELLWYLCTTGATGGKPAWVTEYASDSASADVCCRNHSVPHLSEDHCEVLSDVGASDPIATGSRHGHDGSPRSHRPVDEGFPSSPGWCRSCVLRRYHPWGENLGRRTWHRLDYASAMRTPGPPAECGRVHWRVLWPHHLCPVHGFLDSVSGKSLWCHIFTFSHYIRDKCSKQKEINSSTSFHLSRKCMALTTL